MDNRIPLKPGDKLQFAGMPCEIEKVIGKGSNAMVYLGHYEDSLNKGLFHRVLIKELFPYHPENLILRNPDNSINISPEAQAYYDLQKQSFEYGNEIHLRMLEKHPDKIGLNINTFAENGSYYSVLGFDGGQSLDKLYSARENSLRSITLLMNDIIEATEIFHSAGYLHLDISPDNILVTGSGKSARVSLIDYNSVHRVDEIKSGTALYCSIKNGYTAPEVRSGKLPEICEATDIYSVTAVFYRLLTGKPLSLFETLCKNPPGIRNCALFRDMPDTVISQAETILRRGLATLPERRYRNCQSIKDDFSELLSRIDGVGITHAALWESGKRTVAKMIKANPSLKHLEKDAIFYPICAINADGEKLPIDEAVEKQISLGSAVIYGSAGAGKTTALLHTALRRNRRYSPLQPAFIYVSLFDYNNSGDNFIKNRILEDLKFNTDIRSMEDARNRLIKIFREPIKAKDKVIPGYVLLIDGFNEANGETEPLIKEILALSEMDGLSVFITSRGTNDVFPFSSLELAPLDNDDIVDVLSEYGLVCPESESVKELLKTPLMLSIFCKTAVNNQRQLKCENADDLIKEYIQSLCEKENISESDDSAHNWSVDAAVNFVLPYICATVSKQNKAVTDADLLKTVNKCFRLLSPFRLKYIFPQYIGHSKEIKNNAENAEQWYGTVIIDILWRKMGLLIKEPGRGYRIMHQLLQEYLLKSYKDINRRVKKQNLIIASASVTVTFIVAFVLATIIRPDPYDTALSESYLDSLAVNQAQTGSEISALMDLAEADTSDSSFDIKLLMLNQNLELHKTIIDNGITGSAEMTRKIFDELEETGDVMPWSGKEINENHIDYLFELGEEVVSNYGLYAEILQYLNNNEDMNSKYGDTFRSCLNEKLSADAALSDALFYSTCNIHLSEMEKSEADKYKYYWETIDRYADLSDSEPENPTAAEIERLKKDSYEKANKLVSLEILTVYRRSEQ